MKPQTGNTNFTFTTSHGQELEIEANVYFDSEGDPEMEQIYVSDENGEEIDFETLDIKDRNAIDLKACFEAIPQDEVFDEYEDLEFE